MKTHPGILPGAMVFIFGKVKPAAAQDTLTVLNQSPSTLGRKAAGTFSLSPGSRTGGRKRLHLPDPAEKKKILQKVLPTCEYLETRKSG